MTYLNIRHVFARALYKQYIKEINLLFRAKFEMDAISMLESNIFPKLKRTLNDIIIGVKLIIFFIKIGNLSIWRDEKNLSKKIYQLIYLINVYFDNCFHFRK